ncbi:MAG: putative DsbA family dithiol-disulfide isomerase [Saprospiraceae bacterium]|jgi:predicted DsbA family dithiol-disulfide isomerase
MKFTIDLVSDVVCPWCFVGKRRIEAAMTAMENDEFDINLLPFQLNPDIQEDSIELQQYLIDKFGDLERVTNMQNRLEAVALEQGISMDFSKIKYAHNTLKAHALIQSTNSKKNKLKLNEAFMSAYFEHGKNIGSTDVLEQIALDNDVEFDSNYNTSLNIQAVKQEELKTKQMGVNAVPSFIINGKYLIQGAQPKESFIEVFDKIRAENEI